MREGKELFSPEATGVIRMPGELYWSATPPAVPGWYWIRDASDKKTMIVEVTINELGGNMVAGLSSYGPVNVGCVICSEWCGPLEPPKG